MSDEITNLRFFDFWILEMKNLHWLVLMCLLFIVARFVTFAENIIRKEKVRFYSVTLSSLLAAKILVHFDEPNKTLVLFLFAFGALLPQRLRVVNNWLMIFLYGEEQEASPKGGWEWNGIKSPFKTDFEWFKKFKPVNQNDILISTYFKSGTTWHQVKLNSN